MSRYRWMKTLSSLVIVASAVGCRTNAQRGAVGGAAIGAIAGQAIGRDTKGTLIGAGVGTGIGYIIGNEADKEKAQAMSRASKQYNYTHDEVGKLGGTRWKVVSLAPAGYAKPYASKLVEFLPHGRVITTTTYPDGGVQEADEHYRVVGHTLIINRSDMIVNADFHIRGRELVISNDKFRAVLTRMR